MLKYLLLFGIATIITSCSDSTSTTTSSCGTMPPGLASDSVRIISLVPNPVGNDDKAEQWTVKCFGASADMSQYKVKDSDNINWDLKGALGQCDTAVFVSDKNAQLLNSGETVYLMKANQVIQTITYGEVADGQIVRP